MPRKIKVLVADDHTIVRMGIVSLLETEKDIEVIGEAEDGRAAVKLAAKAKPDVILMDLMMPIMDGTTATKEILRSAPETRVLILTTSTASDEISTALNCGATGAITKNAPYPELIAAIHTVANGQRSISDEIARIIHSDPPATQLSPRQIEILQLIAKGLTNPEIANLLGIGLHMVKEHVNTIFVKIDATNRAEAVTIALRKHLLKI